MMFLPTYMGGREIKYKSKIDGLDLFHHINAIRIMNYVNTIDWLLDYVTLYGDKRKIGSNIITFILLP